MTPERYNELSKDFKLKLTHEELLEGWRFCCEWDGMLINHNNKGEGECCTCKNYPQHIN